MNLSESGLSRVWQHVNDPNTSVALLTAFRKGNLPEVNLQRNRGLAAKIGNLKCGYFYVDGHWVENAGTPDEETVAEDTIFAIRTTDGNLQKEQHFIKQITELAFSYDQEAVLIKTSAGPTVYFADGGIESLNKLSIGSLGQVYTKLRRKSATSTFIFESERDGIGFLQRLAGINPK